MLLGKVRKSGWDLPQSIVRRRWWKAEVVVKVSAKKLDLPQKSVYGALNGTIPDPFAGGNRAAM